MIVERRTMVAPMRKKKPFAGEFMGAYETLSPLGRWIGILSAAFVLLVIILAIFANQIAPFPGDAKANNHMDAIFLPPSSTHWFGTDHEGRDILTRVLFGARTALFTAFIVVFLSAVIGSVIGALAGYAGGKLEMLLMRITDFFLAFPSLLLALVITAVVGPNLPNLIISLVISWWPWYTRQVHQETKVLRQARFVVFARISGVSTWKILLRHIIPNALTPVFVQGASDLGSVIIASASLSYLGLGVQPPAPDWGSMVFSGQQFIIGQWWYVTFPGLAIFLTALCFNLVGDVLRDLLDPTARKS